jgi:hypothetical protein
MVMVEYFANSPTCALGDFACALGGSDADVFAGDGSAFGDIASGVDWVKCDKVARTFPNTLGRRSSALGGSFADVSGTLTDVATWAALMGLLLRRRLRCVGMLRRGLGLAVLTGGVLAPDGKCECEERNEWFWEFGSHGLSLPLVRFDASAEDSLSMTEKLANPNAGVASPNEEEICELRLYRSQNRTELENRGFSPVCRWVLRAWKSHKKLYLHLFIISVSKFDGENRWHLRIAHSHNSAGPALVLASMTRTASPYVNGVISVHGQKSISSSGLGGLIWSARDWNPLFGFTPCESNSSKSRKEKRSFGKMSSMLAPFALAFAEPHPPVA